MATMCGISMRVSLPVPSRYCGASIREYDQKQFPDTLASKGDGRRLYFLELPGVGPVRGLMHVATFPNPSSTL